MVPKHVQDALTQVREMKARILEKQRFKGYSGRARAIGGCVALLPAALVNNFAAIGAEPLFLRVWIATVLLAFAVNYGTVIYWFLTTRGESGSSLRRLRPVLEVAPVFIVGLVLTAQLIGFGAYDILYSTWLCLYGLANIFSRRVLPREIGWLGCAYVLCGAALAVVPTGGFLNPWPFVAIIFVGEWVGGFILHNDGSSRRNILEFFGLQAAMADRFHSQNAR